MHIHDEIPEESGRIAVTGNIGDPVVDVDAVQPDARALGLALGSKPWALEVTLPDNLEVQTSGKGPGLFEVQFEDIDVFRDLWLVDLDARTLPEDRKSTRLNSSHSQISYA